MKRSEGFSLVELLVAAAILGTLLAALGAFFVVNQRVGNEQITAAKLNTDLRLAFLRMSDVASQAQYIYPAGQDLTLDGPTFDTTLTTGANTLAILVPRDTAYCEAATSGYCGFAYTFEDSANHADILGMGDGMTGSALVEYRFEDLSWTENMLPSKTWMDDDASRSPLANSVDVAASSLTDVGTVAFADYSNYDTNAFDFPTTETVHATFASDEKALIKSVTSTLKLRYTFRGKEIATQGENVMFARAVPRAGQP